MRSAIITVAGISSRFNEGIPEEAKVLKAIYHEDDPKKTLLYHLLKKCSYADRVIIVSGYKDESLRNYITTLDRDMREKIAVVYNEYFSDLSSGYSLYLGLKEAFKYSSDEILFVEGDLDIDDESFDRVVNSNGNVLTFTYEPIYSDKAVVLYKDDKEKYRYAFNHSHGMLHIESPFSCILNSGQLWKFTDIEKLNDASDRFFSENKEGTNLCIIQNYLDQDIQVEVLPLKRWTNCNTRDDYKTIKAYW